MDPERAEIEGKSDYYIVNYTQVKSFLENEFGSPNPNKIAIEYTTDIEKLRAMISEIYSFLTDRSIKNKFSRLLKKLKVSIKTTEVTS